MSICKDKARYVHTLHSRYKDATNVEAYKKLIYIFKIYSHDDYTNRNTRVSQYFNYFILHFTDRYDSSVTHDSRAMWSFVPTVLRARE